MIGLVSSRDLMAAFGVTESGLRKILTSAGIDPIYRKKGPNGSHLFDKDPVLAYIEERLVALRQETERYLRSYMVVASTNRLEAYDRLMEEGYICAEQVDIGGEDSLLEDEDDTRVWGE